MSGEPVPLGGPGLAVGNGGVCVQAHEAAAMVCHYLHAHGFAATLGAFHKEAALLLSQVDRVRVQRG